MFSCIMYLYIRLVVELMGRVRHTIGLLFLSKPS